jgi:hypothetical protein
VVKWVVSCETSRGSCYGRAPRPCPITSAFSFKQSQSATASILCGIAIRSCGYTLRIGMPDGPCARSSLDFAALWQLGGGAVKTWRGMGGASGSLSGRRRGPAREIRPFQVTFKPPRSHSQAIW